MLSLGLSFLLVAAWSVAGRGLIQLFGLRLGALRSWLLAPAVGIALQAVATMVLNQAGLPIEAFAWPLEAALMIGALAVLVWRRPAFPGRALLPFYVAAAVFLVWAGWPALRLGFNWISYVNDDFTNYCLSAERFRHYAFFRLPTLPELAGKDYTQYYWFMHVLTLMRFGSEHAVAYLACLTGMSSLRIFMPLILAFGASQILAAAGLTLHHGRWRRPALAVAGALALSPLFLFGALYQLIAQVAGLGLMMTAVALLTARMPSGRRRWRIGGHGVVTAIVCSALALFYPECTPFAVLAFLGYCAVEWWQAPRTSWLRLSGARVVLLEYVLAGMFLILRYNLISYLYTLAHQFVTGTRSADLSTTLFPFFLIPPGFAILFGFQVINRTPGEPFGSIVIVIGFAFLVAAGYGAWQGVRRRNPMAFLLAVMLLMAVTLFRAGNDFGLYKLAMFMQPALLAGVVFAAYFRRAARWQLGVAAALLVALGLPTSWYYTNASTGLKAIGLTEMEHASENMAHVPPAPPAGTHWASNIDNVVSVKLAANLYQGTDVRYLGRDFFFVFSFNADSSWPLLHYFPDPGIFNRGNALLNQRNAEDVEHDRLFGSDFDVARLAGPTDGFLTLPPQISLFNKLHADVRTARQLFVLHPAAGARNLLIFVHSSLGNHYYLGDRRKISFTQGEGDPYNPEREEFGIGRFFLFRLERPSDPFYLRIAASKTAMAPDNKGWSRTAVLHATTDLPLDLHGAGSINRIIGPIHPVMRDGAGYFAVDFGQAPLPFPNVRHGLAALYHREVPLDYRRLVAFGRDFSALTPEEFAALPKPIRVSQFPQDIGQATGLDYSGCYEDGWLSPSSAFVLGAAPDRSLVRLQGFVPEIGEAKAGQTLVVAVNGRSWTLPGNPGLFDLWFPVERPGPATRVQIDFPGAHGQVLPGGDDRPVGAKLIDLAVTAAPDVLEWKLGKPHLPGTGVDADGWTGRKAEVWAPVGARDRTLLVNLEFPGWAGLPPTGTVTLRLDDADAVSAVLKPGPNRISLPIAPGATVRHLRLESPQAFRLPAPDGRLRSFQLVSIAAAP